MQRYKLPLLIVVIVIGVFSTFFIMNRTSLSAPVFYVANAGDGTISEINLENNNPVQKIDLNTEQLSHGIAISPDQKNVYYGTGFQGRSLHALDVATKQSIKETSFEEGIHGIDIHPSGKYLYVSLMAGLGQDGGELAVIDTDSFEEIVRITTDDGPAHVSVSSDGSQVWVTNVNGNTVSAIDAYTFQLLATIPVGELPNEVALSPNMDFAYAANVRSNSLSVIDMATFKVIKEIEVGEGVHGVTVSPDGKTVWTANNQSNDVTVVDVETLSILKSIKTGSYANHISFSPDGNLAFITHREANNIVIIKTKNYKVVKKLQVGEEPHELTLKGMEMMINKERGMREVRPNYVLEKLFMERDAFIEGIEVKVRLLSPFNEEDTLLALSHGEIDLFKSFVLKIDMATHSGDLTSIPFDEKISLINNEGDDIKVDKWMTISNDAHHPQFLAVFKKTANHVPILKNADTSLIVKIDQFLNEEDLVIQLSE